MSDSNHDWVRMWFADADPVKARANYVRDRAKLLAGIEEGSPLWHRFQAVFPETYPADDLPTPTHEGTASVH
jgi:hypothetical protein